MKKPKVLIWDLEFLASKNYNNALKISPGYIICFCCKELGKSHMITYSKLTHPGKGPTDDKDLVRAIGKVLQEADLHIFHYGTKVDFRFIQTKLFDYGFPILPEPPVTVDTHKIAQTKLALKSNSLASVAKFLKLPEQKMPITEDQWYLAFAGDKKTLKLAEERCASDVRLTEMVYKKLKPLTSNHPALNKLVSSAEKTCLVCGGKLHCKGEMVTISKIYKRLQCQGCGIWSKKLLSTKK